MVIALGCDHGGYVLKPEIVQYLEKSGHTLVDFGADDDKKSVDYFDYSYKVAMAIKNKEADMGGLLCGTGIGICMAANKVPGIRCATVSDAFTAQATREHNDANIIAMGGRTIGPGLAVKLVDIFINTPFSNEERHINRIEGIKKIEQEFNK